MTAEVCLTPALIHQYDLAGKSAVIIDIFRATSCMVTGLCEDVRRIYPVSTVEECLEHGRNGKVMAGERGGQKIPEFDIGNSPYDYRSELVKGKDVAVTTTNGTQAIEKSRDAAEVIIGAFLNLTATRDYLLSLDRDIVLHCAGWKGTVNLEDTLYAGALLDALGPEVQLLDDSSLLALSLYQRHADNLTEVSKKSGHAKRLAKFGITRDIEFCMTIDQYQAVIVMASDHLVKK